MTEVDKYSKDHIVKQVDQILLMSRQYTADQADNQIQTSIPTYASMNASNSLSATASQNFKQLNQIIEEEESDEDIKQMKDYQSNLNKNSIAGSLRESLNLQVDINPDHVVNFDIQKLILDQNQSQNKQYSSNPVRSSNQFSNPSNRDSVINKIQQENSLKSIENSFHEDDEQALDIQKILEQSRQPYMPQLSQTEAQKQREFTQEVEAKQKKAMNNVITLAQMNQNKVISFDKKTESQFNGLGNKNDFNEASEGQSRRREVIEPERASSFPKKEGVVASEYLSQLQQQYSTPLSQDFLTQTQHDTQRTYKTNRTASPEAQSEAIKSMGKYIRDLPIREYNDLMQENIQQKSQNRQELDNLEIQLKELHMKKSLLSNKYEQTTKKHLEAQDLYTEQKDIRDAQEKINNSLRQNFDNLKQKSVQLIENFQDKNNQLSLAENQLNQQHKTQIQELETGFENIVSTMASEKSKQLFTLEKELAISLDDSDSYKQEIEAIQLSLAQMKQSIEHKIVQVKEFRRIELQDQYQMQLQNKEEKIRETEEQTEQIKGLINDFKEKIQDFKREQFQKKQEIVNQGNELKKIRNELNSNLKAVQIEKQRVSEISQNKIEEADKIREESLQINNLIMERDQEFFNLMNQKQEEHSDVMREMKELKQAAEHRLEQLENQNQLVEQEIQILRQKQQGVLGDIETNLKNIFAAKQ